MKIEIISTGEEILAGSVVDTNTSWIARLLDEKGYELVRHSTTGDDYDDLVNLFIESGDRSDITIVTGGLGPTSDDRSAGAAAMAAGCDLAENVEAINSIEKYFTGRKGKMSDTDKKQALLPERARCIPNEFGTAPGFRVTIGKSDFFFLPGVPKEMKKLVNFYVLPEIEKKAGKKNNRIFRKSLFLFGLPEAFAGEKLTPLEKHFPEIEIGFRAVFPVIEIKMKYDISSESASDEVETTFARAVDWVFDQVGDYVFSDTDGRIEAAVGRLLLEENKTVAIAESCTGGLIGHKLTNVPGSSDYFLASCVTYANSAKKDILGVDEKTIETYGAVSKETVTEMAEGARRISGADYAIATSGIAGPGGGSPEKPVGTVFIGIAGATGTDTFEFRSPFSDREKNKLLFCIKSLDLLRRKLQA